MICSTDVHSQNNSRYRTKPIDSDIIKQNRRAMHVTTMCISVCDSCIFHCKQYPPYHERQRICMKTYIRNANVIGGSPKHPQGDVCKHTKTKGKQTNRVPYAASCGWGSPKNPQEVNANIQKHKEHIQIGSPMLRRVVGGSLRIPKK